MALWDTGMAVRGRIESWRTRFIVRLPERRVEKNEEAEAIAANRVHMAELTEGFEETKPRPSSTLLRRSDMGGMATIRVDPKFWTERSQRF